MKGGLFGKKVGRNKEVIDKFDDASMNCIDIYKDNIQDRTGQFVSTLIFFLAISISVESRPKYEAMQNFSSFEQ